MEISGSVEVDLLGEDSGKRLQAADSKIAEGSDTLSDVQNHHLECLQNIPQKGFQVEFVVPEIQTTINKNPIYCTVVVNKTNNVWPKFPTHTNLQG